MAITDTANKTFFKNRLENSGVCWQDWRTDAKTKDDYENYEAVNEMMRPYSALLDKLQNTELRF